MRAGLRQGLRSCRFRSNRQIQSRRFLATTVDPQNEQLPEIKAAAPFQFSHDSRGQRSQRSRQGGRSGAPRPEDDVSRSLARLRIVPASASYFTGKPDFTDDLLQLESLLRKYQTLPVLPPGQAPRIAWKTLSQYKVTNGEPVKAARYNKITQLLQRLNYIHRSLMPGEVETALQRYMRDVQPFENKPKPGIVDKWGRARAVGRRKSSHAWVYLVEGEGEVMINGQSLSQAFGRIHDRESAIWALKATDRIDKYNIWAVVKGGGCTGQAEALTLAVGKALLVHEPALKPALRRAGCVTRDPRRVERKKPGKLKARKMPAWVKR